MRHLRNTRLPVEATEWDKRMADGVQAFRKGDYAKAEGYLKAARDEAEKFGSEDPRFATTLTNLAELYYAQGKYGEAAPLYKRSLATREKALGPDHPDVAQSLENYAALLRKTGRDAEAEKLEARAKAIRAKTGTNKPGR